MPHYHKNPDAISSLSPEQYRVTQRDGTERPFDNAYWDNKEPGIYVDVVSGLGNHLKPGHTLSLQNRPTEVIQNKSSYNSLVSVLQD